MHLSQSGHPFQDPMILTVMMINPEITMEDGLVKIGHDLPQEESEVIHPLVRAIVVSEMTIELQMEMVMIIMASVLAWVIAMKSTVVTVLASVMVIDKVPTSAMVMDKVLVLVADKVLILVVAMVVAKAVVIL